jgi:pentatricopeptide repeat protein
MSIYFNLLEAYFATRNIEEADKVFSKMASVQLSNQDRKNKEKYEELFIDLRKRVLTNK